MHHPSLKFLALLLLVGVMFGQTKVDLTKQVKGILPTANGGNGATPGLVAGSNVILSGSWPNQVVNATAGSGVGVGIWGAITGTLSSQTDLQNALNLKAPKADPTFTGTVTLPASGSILGTPASVTLTNATGLPISTGVSGLASGIANFLGTPTSANMAAAITDESGTGVLCLTINCVMTTPTLGVAAATSLTTSGSNGGIDGTEGDCSGLTAASAHDLLCPNSTAHAWQVNNNNGGFKTVAVTVVSGTSALGTSAVSSATCATVVTTAATGVATTDNIQADFNADPTAVNGYSPSSAGMLTIIKYPTANNVNFKACNNTAGSITPGAITLNWRVAR